MKKQLASVLALSVIMSNSMPAINVFADEVIKEKAAAIERELSKRLSIGEFSLTKHPRFAQYDEQFKVGITSITGNGGENLNSVYNNAIDGKLDTHWESKDRNSASLKNELVLGFEETTDINRLVYTVRQDASKGKGFPKSAQIFVSTEETGDDFELVGEATGTAVNHKTVEYKFDTVSAKRIKFVFVEIEREWASAAEVWVYKEDKVMDMMANLFTDANMNRVNPDYATKATLDELEEQAKQHPFYEDYKEDIANAKAILEGKEITATTAKVSKLVGYGSDNEQAYNQQFMVPRHQITKVESKGGTWGNHIIENMFDADPSTMWESNTDNTDTYQNELTFTFETPQVLDRFAYMARDNRWGFPEEFEIYASETSKGDTFQKVAVGSAKETNDFLQFKFEPTKFKRLKFKFKKTNHKRVYAGEIRFLKQDAFSEKMDTLFANDKLTAVNKEFAKEGALEALEKEAKKHPLYNTFKEDISNAKALLAEGKIEAVQSATKRVDYVNNEEYVNQFGISRDKIKGITNNAGHYASQVITNAIDGDQKTYWETNRGNSADWKNEVTIDFKEDIVIDRIALGARQSDRKGFLEEFEIYASSTTKGDNFQLVATAKGNKTTGLVEAKFNPTKFRRVKIKAINSDSSWATLNEVMFFQEDSIYNKMNSLFTDETMSVVSEEFAKPGALAELEEQAKKHPLYDAFIEDLTNAKALLSQGKIEAVDAKTKKIDYVNNEDYMAKYAISRDKIKGISNNAGHWSDMTIDKAIDGDQSTHWETNRANSANWKNEVIVEFTEPTTFNRIAYGARISDRKGFIEEFEVYGSTTSKGETFQKVATGRINKTTGMVEAKFGNQTFKRIKLKAIKSDADWATLNELMFFTEDETSDKIERLFTNSNLNEVSEEFRSAEAFKALENEAKAHPLYDNFKEDLYNAKAILNPQGVKETKISTRVANYLENKEYMKKFNVPHTEVKNITNNGGYYREQFIKNAVDGKTDTYWETNKYSTDTWKNEVIVEFDDVQTLDRIAYGSRPDGKGFIETFEVYASETTKGETFHKVGTGRTSRTTGLVEAKFNPTKFKRLKLVAIKANENWPTINELMFFKQDSVADRVNDLFTDSLMNELKPEFATTEAINKLAEEVAKHPLKDELQEHIDRAKEVLKSPENFKQHVFELESRGDSVKETQKRKMWNFQDWLPTGLGAKSGDEITVYVDAEPGEPIPHLMFKQMDVQNNGTIEIKLKNGKNVITVPKISGTTIRKGVPYSGVLYAVNPYTEDQQSRMPKIKIEGAFEYPHFIKGVDTDEEVMQELREYEERRKADPELPDVIDIFGDKTLTNVKGSFALDWFTKNGKTPSYSANRNDEVHGEAMKYWGFDGSSEVNSDFNYRYVSMVKYLDGGGFMNAGNGITGFNVGSQGGALDCETGWGNMHEMGHNMDTNTMSIQEVTNNMLPLHFQMINKQPARMSGDFDSKLYPKLTKEDYSENAWYPDGDWMNIQHVFPLWQLQMYDNTFWPRMQQYLRANNIGGGSWDDKHETWAIVASDVLKLDLTEFFQRHGFRPRQATLDHMKQYAKPDKKLWYANDNMYLGSGKEFKGEVTYDVKAKVTGENITLNYSVNKENKGSTMGYEIYRDGEYLGFTKGGQYVDKDVDATKNHVYTVKAFNNNIEPASTTGETKSLQPVLSVVNNVVVKLNGEFDEMDYVKALDNDGTPITDINVESNVNTSKLGDYTVTYEVENEHGKVSKQIKVTVVSKYDYLSDRQWTSVTTGWGEASRNQGIKGRLNGEIKNFTKGIRYHADGNVVYNLGDHEYEYLDMRLGIDQNVSENNQSSVFFKVLVDGKEVAKTDIIRYHDDLEHVRVPIKGADKIEIMVDKSGDYSIDNSVIVEPKLLTNNARPEITAPNSVSVKVGDTLEDFAGDYSARDAEDGDLTSKVKVTLPENIDFTKPGRYQVGYTVTDSQGNTSKATRNIVVYDERDSEYVSNHDWKSQQTGWKEALKDKSVSGNELRLTNSENKEVVYKKGIGTHAHSEIVYDLTDKNVDHFTSWVGVDRNQLGRPSSIEFKVLADGKEVYKSGVMRVGDAQKFVAINLTGVKELKLVVTDGGDGNGSDHGNWADAKFYSVNEDRGYSAELVKLMDEAKKINAEEYTEESFKDLTDAITKAEELIKDEDALTKKAVDAMIKEVQGTIDSLVGADLTTVVEVPDAYLRKALAKVLDKDNGFTTGDMLKVTELNLGNGVESLEGLQHAKNLVTLNGDYNEVKDLRPLAKLAKLDKVAFDNQFVQAGMLDIVDGQVKVNTEAYNRAGKNVATKISVVNTKGEVVKEVEVNSKETTLDFNELTSGNYSITVVFEDAELNGSVLYMTTVK